MRNILARPRAARVPALLAAGLSSIYPNLIQVPEKYWDVEMTGFTRNPSLLVRQWKDLAGLRVAYPLGWKIYEENVKGAEVSTATSHEALFRMLLGGRVDVVLLQRLDGLALVKSLGIADVRVLEPPLAVMPHYLYLHARHKDLIPRLSAELARMKRDGRYEAIAARVLAGG